MIGRPILRLGRPSLLQSAARTAVAAGTATVVSGGLMRRRTTRDAVPAEVAAHEQSVQVPTAQGHPA